MVAQRAGGAFVLSPLTLRGFTVVSQSLEKAQDELALALDDRISRLHPRYLPLWLRGGSDGALVELEISALKVWGAEETATRPLTVSTIVSPAHHRFVEVFAPRWGLRFWVEAGEEVPERAAERLTQHAATLTDAELLRLRRSGPESVHTIVIEPTLKPLSALSYRELFFDERPVPGSTADGLEDTESDDEAAIAEAYDIDAGFAAKRNSSVKKQAIPRPVPSQTPTLQKLGDPWHVRAKNKEFVPAFGRDLLVQDLVRRLSDDKPDAVVLVGPHGVGKTAIIQEVARRLVRDPQRSIEREFYYVDGSRLIAGDGYFGDWQKQLFDVLQEAQKTSAILALGSLTVLLDAGRSEKRDDNVAQLLAPALLAREVIAIGEATQEEWTEIERRNPHFSRAFAVIRVDDPGPEQLRAIVARVCEEFSQQQSVTIEPAVVDRSIALTKRFFAYGATLGNAVSFLRRVLQARVQARATTVTESSVVTQFSSESGIPQVLLRDDMALDPREVQQALRGRVVGQELAIERVTEVVSVLKAGLQDTRKPTAVLFFSGPTGVGKTELARTLAQYVFGSEDRLVRLDMGEYNGYDALARLVGEWNSPGTLCAAVRRQPFSVVLLDEIEKAHPLVFDALLGVLGEGRLSDSAGRFTDFRNCVLIMTSNLGADTLKKPMGFSAASSSLNTSVAARAQRQHYVAAASEFFRPELFNRIDDFVVFDRLSPDAVHAVVVRELKKLSQREGLKRTGVQLVPTEAAVAWLAQVGTDERYGARPLKRAIERHVTIPLASFLLQQTQGQPQSQRPVASRGVLRVALELLEQRLQFRVLTASNEESAALSKLSEILSLAQSLRVQTQQWTRSPKALALREESNSLERSSKLPGFWQDSDSARETVRRGSQAKSLVGLLDSAEQQAIATEDLAFEAYYDRSANAQELLFSEFAELREKLRSVWQALFYAGFPSFSTQGASVLYLGASRAAWKWLEWLRNVYLAQAARMGIGCTVYYPVVAAALKAPESKKKSASAAVPTVGWSSAVSMPGDGAPSIIALSFRTEDARLFSSEAGTHRIHGEGAHLAVKVAFATAPLSNSLLSPLSVETRFSSEEVRKVFRERRLIRDLRTNAESSWGELPSDLPALDPIFEAWVRTSVLK